MRCPKKRADTPQGSREVMSGESEAAEIVGSGLNGETDRNSGNVGDVLRRFTRAISTRAAFGFIVFLMQKRRVLQPWTGTLLSFPMKLRDAYTHRDGNVQIEQADVQ